MSEKTPAAPGQPAAPGWYPDTTMVNTRRYWDGEAWTDHRQEASATPHPETQDAATGAIAGPQSRGGGQLSRSTLIRVGIGALAVAGVVVGVVAVVGTSSKFTVQGVISLGHYNGEAGECAGSSGYEDIAGGAEIIIRDSKGDRVGVGELNTGRFQPGSKCTFAFKIPDVPDHGSLYSIEVGHRGEVTFKKGDASSIALTVGD